MTDQRTAYTRFGITPVVILAYGAYYLSGTWGGRFETVGYGALCGTILTLLVLIIAGRGAAATNSVNAMRAWIVQRPLVIRYHWPALVMSVSMLAYVSLQGWIGFLPATGITALWLLSFLRAGGMVRVGLLTLTLTALAWLLLVHFLSVPLPAAPWVV